MGEDLDHAERRPVLWQTYDWPCPLCDSSDRRLIGRRGGAAHRAGHGVEATVVRCGNCGCYYTSPTLVPESNPYADETPAEYFRIHEPEKKRQAGRRLASHAESLLGRKGTILEVGCGRGELLEGAKDVGWVTFG